MTIVIGLLIIKQDKSSNENYENYKSTLEQMINLMYDGFI